MNIIIVGAGEIGRHLASVLSQEAHNISVIEKDAALASELEQAIDAKVIHGNGSSIEDLVEADVGDCDLFVALTSSNTANMMSASMAKALGVGEVISRVHPGLQREEWLFDFKGHFGIDHIFSSERLTAIEMAKYIRNPDSMVVEELARGRIELQQLRVGENSQAIGIPLRKLGAPTGIRLAMVTRGGENSVPDAETELAANDIVTIFGEPRKMRDFAQRLQGRRAKRERMSVVIFGGNEYGFTLAQMLESVDCNVRIFEKDPALCHKLADRLANTTVIQADATMVAELKEEQVGDADFFIATSADDEDNVMSCLQAHTLGAANCLTLIHRADYAAAISASGHHFGIRSAVSPREATRREIQRFITTDKFHVMKSFPGAKLIEMRVAKGAIATGHMIHEVEWPQGAVLVGHLRGIHADVPGPDTVLLADDHIYAVVADASLKPFLRLLSA
ncbi:MAG: Trk system potassium transporter TrkA [Verrucomicrobiae bacterium]|nr:Trk system potassium transporter TrkA [Verrucomicrobiae bacterium]MCP5533212.1 Trk system potassium transporter TrkA [Akkermansiaceae bacterium]MCP5545165.1 Trk system potassium transporter TrkA [Akkermansiaceae bacterium]MCP5547218.1 Trk system potassium transporter TrkA [Akkermansiaceae bacterium]